MAVDVPVEVFYKNVASATLPQAWITLAPHDSTRSPLDAGKVQGVESTFSIGNTVEVDITIAHRATGYTVATDASGSDVSDGIEDLVEHCFRDIRVKIANVE